MKTKPIGVRFDEKMLEIIKKEQNCTSPQQVLNWLLDHYEDAKTWVNRMAETTEAIKRQPKITITTTSVRDLNQEAIAKGAPIKKLSLSEQLDLKINKLL